MGIAMPHWNDQIFELPALRFARAPSESRRGLIVPANDYAATIHRHHGIKNRSKYRCQNFAIAKGGKGQHSEDVTELGFAGRA